jgi:hypothetical protein
MAYPAKSVDTCAATSGLFVSYAASLFSLQHDALSSTACTRFNGDTANGPSAIYERERFLLSYVAISEPH